MLYAMKFLVMEASRPVGKHIIHRSTVSLVCFMHLHVNAIKRVNNKEHQEVHEAVPVVSGWSGGACEVVFSLFCVACVLCNVRILSQCCLLRVLGSNFFLPPSLLFFSLFLRLGLMNWLRELCQPWGCYSI